MRIERVIVVACLLAGAAWAVDAVRTRLGVGAPSAGQLQPGELATATNTLNLYVGNASSQAVLVGSAAWSNNVSASATNVFADTNFVNTAVAGRVATNDAAYLASASTGYVDNAVAGYLPTNTVFGITTNLSVLDLSTNSLTLYFTNGLFKGASSP